MVLADPKLDIRNTNQVRGTASMHSVAAGERMCWTDEFASDLQLVEGLRQRNAEALEILAQRHQHRVLRLVVSILKNPMEAEEAVQDVFFTVFEKIHTFRGDSSFSTWIHRIAVNAALLRRRRDKSAANLSLDENVPALNERSPWLETAAAWSSPARDTALDDEARKVIEDTVARLDSKYRAVFKLRDVEGFSIESTARMLEFGTCQWL